MSEIEKYTEKIFEDIKHIDENGNEYWEARELQSILGYKEWRYFSSVIEKAQIACLQSKNNVSCHFGVYTKIVSAGVSKKTVIDYKLSRYACYLIVQNSNPKYEAVALGRLTLLFKLEKWSYRKKNILNYLKMKKDYIEEDKPEMVIKYYIK